VLLAALLAVTTAAVLLYSYTADAHSFAQHASDARLQARAFLASEKALKACVEDGGEAKCEGGFVFVNEVAGNNKKLAKTAAAEEAKRTNRACVTRIVLTPNGRQETAEYCAENELEDEQKNEQKDELEDEQKNEG
jgi:hypothetical protein